jgi:hypothetical protein
MRGRSSNYRPAVAPKLARMRLAEGLRELGLGRINRDGFWKIMAENHLDDNDIDNFLRGHDPAANRLEEMAEAF